MVYVYLNIDRLIGSFSKASSRGVSRKEESKEDKMAEFGEELATKLMLLATPAFRCEESDLATHHINILERAAKENPKAVVSGMLATLSSEQLKVVNDNLNNNNFEHKTETLAKAVFSHDFEVAAHKVNAMGKMKEALKTVTRIAFTAQFYTRSYDWDAYNNEVYEAVKLRAQADVAPPANLGLGA